MLETCDIGTIQGMRDRAMDLLIGFAGGLPWSEITGLGMSSDQTQDRRRCKEALPGGRADERCGGDLSPILTPPQLA